MPRQECSSFSNDIRICKEPQCAFLCPHMYSCDSKCYDYNNGHVCKHIHRVHSVLCQSNKPETLIIDVDNDMNDSLGDNISYAESVFDPIKGTVLITMCACM